jgi:hypothetical protein
VSLKEPSRADPGTYAGRHKHKHTLRHTNTSGVGMHVKRSSLPCHVLTAVCCLLLAACCALCHLQAGAKAATEAFARAQAGVKSGNSGQVQAAAQAAASASTKATGAADTAVKAQASSLCLQPRFQPVALCCHANTQGLFRLICGKPSQASYPGLQCQFAILSGTQQTWGSGMICIDS